MRNECLCVGDWSKSTYKERGHLLQPVESQHFAYPRSTKSYLKTRLVFYRLMNIFPTAEVVLLPPLTPLSETA